jgi:hypothetical protein
MTKRIKATGDGACLFNAMAIGLTIEILSGRLDTQKDAPGYQTLLNEFAQHHPNFKPKSWDALKEWLAHYNHPRDIELILAPVLFKLNRRLQQNLDITLLNELTNLVWKNKAAIQNGSNWFQLTLMGEYGDSLCPNIDILRLNYRADLLQSLQNILPDFTGEISREKVNTFLQQKAQHILKDLKEKTIKDPNAFQKAFSCDDLKPVTDLLSVNLQENKVNSAFGKKTTIRLVNSAQHWDVECNDNEINLLLDSASPNKLPITSLEAFQGQIGVTAPTVSAPKNEEIKQDDNAPNQLLLLKQSVQKATDDYIQYSESILVSIFHHHGKKGRSRAKAFNEKFKTYDDYDEAKKELITYLQDKKNGNTYPHSYRTMLLHQLLPEDAKGSLAETAQYFESGMEFFNKQPIGTVNSQI